MPVGSRGDSCSKLALSHSVTSLPCSGKTHLMKSDGRFGAGSQEEGGTSLGMADSFLLLWDNAFDLSDIISPSVPS